MGKNNVKKVNLKSKTQTLDSLIKIMFPKNTLPFTYKVVGDRKSTVVFTGDDETLVKVKEKLEQDLGSPEAFRRNLGYNVVRPAELSESKKQLSDEMPVVEQPHSTFDAGYEILTRLFPSEIGQGILFVAASIFIEKNGALVNNGVLFSEPTTAFYTKQMWEIGAAAMLQVFDNIPVSEIRKAWVDGTGLPAVLNSFGTAHKFAKGLLLECFGTVDEQLDDQTSSKRLYFNFAKLYQLLFPPKLSQVAGTLTVDLEHLTMYLKQLLSEGFLLKIDDKQSHANPIFLEGLSTIEKPLHLSFVLDMSSSMSGSEPAYRKNVIRAIESIKEKLSPAQIQKAKVSFEYFSSDVKELVTFNLADENGIKNDLSNIRCDGSTAVFKGMHKTVEMVRENPNENHVVVLFTDGVNNEYPEYQQKLIDIMHQTMQNKAYSLTAITLGLGDSLDKAILESLSTNTGSDFYPVDRVSELYDKLQENAIRMQYEHRLVDLLYGENSFVIPIPKDGTPTEAAINIPFYNGKVDLFVDGEEYIVTLTHAKQLTPAGSQGLQRLTTMSTGGKTVADDHEDQENTLRSEL